MSSAAETLLVRVAAKRDEARDICSLELEPAAGQALPAFSAGSHVDVHLPGGTVRQYSLCNDARETHRYLIAVLREPASRGGSSAVHDAVRVGDTLRISAPRNHFAIAGDAPRHLLVAGGIGITPLLCMAERLAATGADFRLHYAARSRDRAAFLDRIRDAAFAPRAAFHFDDEAPEQRFDVAAALAGAGADAHLYVCGPAGFMDAVLGAARAAGWPEARLHFEFFTAPQGQAAGAPADSFEVQIASSGRVVVVPADKTVVQALADAGIEVMVSCEQGVCGTCLTRVLEGEVDHRDGYLTAAEQATNTEFTPCCSRARSSRLVLDL